jgi:hypothetical protein
MTEEQIKEMNKVRKIVGDLSLQMCQAYDSLVEKLELKGNKDAQEWLFEYVHDTSIEDKDESRLNYYITRIEDNL